MNRVIFYRVMHINFMLRIIITFSLYILYVHRYTLHKQIMTTICVSYELRFSLFYLHLSHSCLLQCNTDFFSSTIYRLQTNIKWQTTMLICKLKKKNENFFYMKYKMIGLFRSSKVINNNDVWYHIFSLALFYSHSFRLINQRDAYIVRRIILNNKQHKKKPNCCV